MAGEVVFRQQVARLEATAWRGSARDTKTLQQRKRFGTSSTVERSASRGNQQRVCFKQANRHGGKPVREKKPQAKRLRSVRAHRDTHTHIHTHTQDGGLLVIARSSMIDLPRRLTCKAGPKKLLTRVTFRSEGGVRKGPRCNHPSVHDHSNASSFPFAASFRAKNKTQVEATCIVALDMQVRGERLIGSTTNMSQARPLRRTDGWMDGW